MHTAAAGATRIVRAHARSLLLLVLLVVGALCGGWVPAQAGSLVLFDFANDVQSSDTDANSTASLDRWTVDTHGISPVVGNPAPSAGNYTRYSTVGDARVNDQVFQFTLTPHSGYTISLSSISFDIAANKTPAATNDQSGQAFVYTNLDNSAPVAAGFATDTTNDSVPSAFGHWSFDLSSNPLYENVTAPITFSLYVFGSDANSFLLLDNILVEGATAAVPEPSSFALLAFGSLAIAGYAARQRSRI